MTDTRPIQPQYACLCGTRSDEPGVCCGGAMYLVEGMASMTYASTSQTASVPMWPLPARACPHSSDYFSGASA